MSKPSPSCRPRLAREQVISRIDAWQSPTRLRSYRYRLGFQVNAAGRGRLLVIGLNPSTATLTTRDPTVDSFCRAFAVRAGFRELEIGNLFGLRSTDKAALVSAADPVGPGNDVGLLAAVEEADAIVVAWGAYFHPLIARRAASVLTRLSSPLLCIGVNADGSPLHPLYRDTRQPLASFDRSMALEAIHRRIDLTASRPGSELPASRRSSPTSRRPAARRS